MVQAVCPTCLCQAGQRGGKGKAPGTGRGCSGCGLFLMLGSPVADLLSSRGGRQPLGGLSRGPADAARRHVLLVGPFGRPAPERTRGTTPAGTPPRRPEGRDVRRAPAVPRLLRPGGAVARSRSAGPGCAPVGPPAGRAEEIGERTSPAADPAEDARPRRRPRRPTPDGGGDGSPWPAAPHRPARGRTRRSRNLEWPQ